MFTMPMRGVQTIHISEDQASHFDVGPWVRAGQALFTVVIDSGVTVNSTDATLGGAIYSSVAIDAVRSLVTIRNSGTILGCNGSGGNGGYYSLQVPTGGSKGCDGVDLNCPIVLHNNGQITSGGGGGGGGGLHSSGGTIFEYAGCGGGGNPGGSGNKNKHNTTYSSDGQSAIYGAASGGSGPSGDNKTGGSCNGPATAGGKGADGNIFSGASGGAAGIGVNSNGNGVTIVSGDANILGGVDLEV